MRMLSGIPNMPTRLAGHQCVLDVLKADSRPEFVCRLLNYMDDNGLTPRSSSDRLRCRRAAPFMEFTQVTCCSLDERLRGPVHRGAWNQNCLSDIRLTRRGKIDDEGLRFASARPGLATV